eukprot:12368756-Ditylum_brightwellii.AAC.1
MEYDPSTESMSDDAPREEVRVATHDPSEPSFPFPPSHCKVSTRVKPPETLMRALTEDWMASNFWAFFSDSFGVEDMYCDEGVFFGRWCGDDGRWCIKEEDAGETKA